MEKAFRGAYGAFCVTNFWEHMSPEREIAQATAMAKAAKAAGMQHAIWSTLEDSRKYIPLSDDRMPTLHGKWKVPHFDAKGVARRVIPRGRRADDVPAHLVLLGQPHPLRHGPATRARMARWASCCRWASGSSRHCGQRHRPSGVRDLQGGQGIHRQDGRHIGGTPDRRRDGRAAVGGSGQRGATPGGAAPCVSHVRFSRRRRLGNMFQFNHDFSEQFREARDVEFSRRLNPSMQTFSQWLAQNAHRIPLELAMIPPSPGATCIACFKEAY